MGTARSSRPPPSFQLGEACFDAGARAERHQIEPADDHDVPVKLRRASSQSHRSRNVVTSKERPSFLHLQKGKAYADRRRDPDNHLPLPSSSSSGEHRGNSAGPRTLAEKHNDGHCRAIGLAQEIDAVARTRQASCGPRHISAAGSAWPGSGNGSLCDRRYPSPAAHGTMPARVLSMLKPIGSGEDAAARELDPAKRQSPFDSCRFAPPTTS